MLLEGYDTINLLTFVTVNDYVECSLFLSLVNETAMNTQMNYEHQSYSG